MPPFIQLRRFGVTALFVSIFLFAYSTASDMRVVTWNLRYDAQPNDVTVQESLQNIPDPLVEPQFLELTSEQPWSIRRIRVAERLLGENVSIAGFQEALVRQVRDLAELLGNEWEWVGVGRDDGIAAGEFSPIFYKKTDLTLLSNDSFWLSDTPFEPSRYPGAGSFRVCTVARFELNASAEATSRSSEAKKITVLNTHLDDRSDDQRQVAASLLLTRARYEAVNTGGPVIVMGDFNSPSTGRDSAAYNITTGQLQPVSINSTFAERFAVNSDEFPDFKMLDLRGYAPRERVSTTYVTFTGFRNPQDTSVWSRIDFIFGGSNGGWRADAYKVETAMSDDGLLASDHRPVFVDLTL